MGTVHDRIDDRLRAFIEAQHVFFVGTAARDGRVNVSPKGLDSLRVVGPNRVLWLSVTGSTKSPGIVTGSRGAGSGAAGASFTVSCDADSSGTSTCRRSSAGSDQRIARSLPSTCRPSPLRQASCPIRMPR